MRSSAGRKEAGILGSGGISLYLVRLFHGLSLLPLFPLLLCMFPFVVPEKRPSDERDVQNLGNGGEKERGERDREREIEKERESDLDERCGNCEREDERGRQIDRKIGYFPRDGVFRSEKKAREGGREVRRGGSPTGVKIASHVPGDSVDLIWFPHRAQHLGSSLVHSALKLASLDPEMLHSFFLSIYCPRPSTERRIEEESRFY